MVRKFKNNILFPDFPLSKYIIKGETMAKISKNNPKFSKKEGGVEIVLLYKSIKSVRFMIFYSINIEKY